MNGGTVRFQVLSYNWRKTYCMGYALVPVDALPTGRLHAMDLQVGNALSASVDSYARLGAFTKLHNRGSSITPLIFGKFLGLLGGVDASRH